MALLRIVVVKNEEQAATEARVLEQDGFSDIKGPDHYEKANWQGGGAEGTDDVVRDVWVVQGTK